MKNAHHNFNMDSLQDMEIDAFQFRKVINMGLRNGE